MYKPRALWCGWVFGVVGGGGEGEIFFFFFLGGGGGGGGEKCLSAKLLQDRLGALITSKLQCSARPPSVLYRGM